MTPFLANFGSADGEPRLATTLCAALAKKPWNLDLNVYRYDDRLWESTLRRRPAFNPADLSRAPADLTDSGAQVTVWAKLTFRNYDLQTPWLEPSLTRLANLEGGDDIVIGSDPEERGKPVNRDFRCSYK